MTNLPKNPNEAISNLAQRKSNKDGLSENDVKQLHPVYNRPKGKSNKNDSISIDFDSLFVKHARQLVPDYEINKVIITLNRYMIGYPNFNEYGLIKNSDASLKKGILVHGDFGVGKTMYFKIISNINQDIFNEYGVGPLGFTSISAPWFVNAYMSANASASSRKNTQFDLEYYQKDLLYIDDLGAEHLCFNSFELLSDVLFERHKNNAKTYVTTNYPPSKLSARYGERIGDRLPEMFNIIKWSGESYRTKKNGAGG